MTIGAHDTRAMKILFDFYRAKKIVDHAKQVRNWPKWKQIGHRLIAAWRCPACIAYKKGEHEGWGIE